MTFEGLTVSVNYGDYLALTLPENVSQFDRFVVVTSPDDKQTRQVCARCGVECVISKRLHLRGAAFNKGGLLNDGLAKLTRQGWIAALDADIALGSDFRYLAEQHAAQQQQHATQTVSRLYGAKRRICEDYEAWRRYKRERAMNRLPLSVRDLQNQVRFGPAGVGYLAMFHARDEVLAGREHCFAEWLPDAQLVDVEFARRWGKRREWLPLDVVHVGPIERNWHGRVSPSFAPRRSPAAITAPPRDSAAPLTSETPSAST